MSVKILNFCFFQWFEGANFEITRLTLSLIFMFSDPNEKALKIYTFWFLHDCHETCTSLINDL